MKFSLIQSVIGSLVLVFSCALARGGEQEGGKPLGRKVRVPYASEDGPELADLIRAISARRPGGRLLNLDRMLLNSPPLAGGWNTMIGAIRSQLEVPPKLRELAIMAVAVLNSADYEYTQHREEFLAAGGTAAQLGALKDVQACAVDNELFDEQERASLQLVFEMTRQVVVADSTVARLRSFMPDRQVVELIGTVAAYNMVSRFLVALQIEPEE